MKKLAIVLSLLLLLTSCQGITMADGVELLHAPMLNQEQKAVYEALETTLDTSQIVYRTPREGNIKTPFTFFDLDGDGTKEAIVFFSEKPSSGTSTPKEVRAKVLVQDTKGEWYSFRDVAGYGNQIAFIDFAPMIVKDKYCMIIGWENSNNLRDNAITVYSMEAGKIETNLVEYNYSGYSLHDYTKDGLSDLLIANTNNFEVFELLLYQEKKGALVPVDATPLNQSTFSILQMIPGKLWNGNPAVYIDERIQEDSGSGISSYYYATEVVEVNNNSFRIVAGANAEEKSQEQSNYSSTNRTDAVLSADLWDDGRIFVPEQSTLPGTKDGDEKKKIKLTEYKTLTSSGFETSYNTIVNSDDGYFIVLPDRWIGNVMVARQPDRREWRICKIDFETDTESTELFRVRVRIVSDVNTAISDNEVLLGTKGSFEYYGYIPEITDEPLAITETEAKEIFSFISLD